MPIRNEDGSALILIVGLLMLCIGVLVVAFDATHYYLQQRALSAAIDRSLMIVINTYDFSLFYESGKYSDISLDAAAIEREFPALLQAEISGARVIDLDITNDAITATAALDWIAPLGIGEVGKLVIEQSATIKVQTYS